MPLGAGATAAIRADRTTETGDALRRPDHVRATPSGTLERTGDGLGGRAWAQPSTRVRAADAGDG